MLKSWINKTIDENFETWKTGINLEIKEMIITKKEWIDRMEAQQTHGAQIERYLSSLEGILKQLIRQKEQAEIVERYEVRWEKERKENETKESK